MVAGVLFV